MNRSSQANFVKRTGLKLLISFLPWKIEWSLLLSASTFWNPQTHVFNFGLNEMSPTIEEFEAILGCRKNKSIAIPKNSRPIVEALQEFLGLDCDVCTSMIHGNKVNFSLLPKLFINEDGDKKCSKYQENAFALCMISHFLFYDSPGMVDERVIEVVIQAMDLSHNIIPLVLAETTTWT